MAAKRTASKNGTVTVERVLTSDSFLTRELAKAPMRQNGTSLIADLGHLPNDLKIVIQGAREHNLKDVDLEVPRNRMVVFTGLSGSGKSSLAFDTLFAEGQRRYVESLSAYARQFLGQMDKPDVDFIEGTEPRRVDRPEDHEPQPAFDGRHDYGDLRLPASAVRPHRHPALSGVRRVGQRADPAADGRYAAGVSGAHPFPDPRAGGPRAQGRVRGPAGDAARRRLCARADRRRECTSCPTRSS